MKWRDPKLDPPPATTDWDDPSDWFIVLCTDITGALSVVPAQMSENGTWNVYCFGWWSAPQRYKAEHAEFVLGWMERPEATVE